jgi:hypothetical protein
VATPSSNRHTFLYFASLTLIVYLVAPHNPLLDIPVSYMLKNRLHATATQVSTFRLVVALPMYLAFVFGLTRDLWNPFGWRDRGFFVLFTPVTAGVFIWMALSRLSQLRLLIGMILAIVSFQFVIAAYQGLIALIGQEKLISGRLSTLQNVLAVLPAVVASFASGFISERLSPSQTFSLAAALTLSIGMFGYWKPYSVFSHTYEKAQARGADLVGDVKRLVKHRAIYPAVVINFLWNFIPGVGTPLQFHLANQLHASDAVYSYFYGIYLASYVPTFLLYGYLCTRVPLYRLLWRATVVGLPGLVPLLLVHSGNTALLVAVPIGLMGGLANAAYYDLAIRSCPPGCQGTLMMLVTGLWTLAARGGGPPWFMDLCQQPN